MEIVMQLEMAQKARQMTLDEWADDYIMREFRKLAAEDDVEIVDKRPRPKLATADGEVVQLNKGKSQ
jgi:hypothetical protein